ncbi:MAG: hypothetical protein A2149_00405 [Candidatus Schekmanbacteria bacterium RBG_16_38_11]|uniref:Transglutaminase-like domain-containing protein n=2 Tax=Candidatus Schekmaniibacteriota TaxID=1817811 RepID=A0A1F7RCW1_9BACT|nr:MAG: hypothetical protein A2042_07705 [Candidatus Schekmanbacteria bacterium GWA2_38_11]OGL46591.1 MAG: hypothetical protein A2149_00405 [Candidatus Schekmanbacteria bacterium RBG_16_38_11]
MREKEARREDFKERDSAQVPINKYNLYLKSTPLIQADNPEIKKVAAQISNGEKNAYKFSRKAVEWMEKNIGCRLIENFSALDTLKSREGECQSTSYLYADFLMASKILCRLVAGIVYPSNLRGFIYH